MDPIDSCATNKGGCHHECVHTARGPVCSCYKGYILQSDGKMCAGL